MSTSRYQSIGVRFWGEKSRRKGRGDLENCAQTWGGEAPGGEVMTGNGCQSGDEVISDYGPGRKRTDSGAGKTDSLKEAGEGGM